MKIYVIETYYNPGDKWKVGTQLGISLDKETAQNQANIIKARLDKRTDLWYEPDVRATEYLVDDENVTFF